MFIHQMFEEKPFVFSLEIFPPKKKSGNIQSIYQTIEALLNVHPDFISVTFGAGGNLADNSTCEIASTIKNKYGVESVAHLTCVNSSREDVAVMLDRLYQSNVENILALRGDINPDIPPKKDFLYASDLVRVIKQDGRFGISGGCYPECHCEAPDLKTDIAHLKEKVDAGVSHLVSSCFLTTTQFSFLEKIARRH